MVNRLKVGRYRVRVGVTKPTNSFPERALARRQVLDDDPEWSTTIVREGRRNERPWQHANSCGRACDIRHQQTHLNDTGTKTRVLQP